MAKLGGIIIDCPVESLSMAGEFWSKALNLEITNPNENNEGKYVILKDQNGLKIEIQKINQDRPAGVHIDIKTNNVEQEVIRLKELGAIHIESCKDWVIMQAPTGQKFCVIPDDEG